MHSGHGTASLAGPDPEGWDQAGEPGPPSLPALQGLLGAVPREKRANGRQRRVLPALETWSGSCSSVLHRAPLRAGMRRDAQGLGENSLSRREGTARPSQGGLDCTYSRTDHETSQFTECNEETRKGMISPRLNTVLVPPN